MTDEVRTATGSFQITIVLTDKRQINMTGYVYSDDTQHDIDKRLDSYMDVLDRQLVRADVTNKEAQLAQQDTILEQHAARFQAFAELKQSGQKLSIQQKNELTQYDTNVQFVKRQKESLRAAIAEGKKRLNGAAAA